MTSCRPRLLCETTSAFPFVSFQLTPTDSCEHNSDSLGFEKPQCMKIGYFLVSRSYVELLFQFIFVLNGQSNTSGFRSSHNVEQLVIRKLVNNQDDKHDWTRQALLITKPFVNKKYFGRHQQSFAQGRESRRFDHSQCRTINCFGRCSTCCLPSVWLHLARRRNSQMSSVSNLYFSIFMCF